MHIYTGVDILKISRIEKSLENPSFLQKVFTSQEIKLYKSRQNSTSFLAGNFAAKEAFSKSLGTGLRGFSLGEVSVLRDDYGKPYFEFSGKALDIVKNKSLSFDVSISNEKDYVVAFVIAFKNS